MACEDRDNVYLYCIFPSSQTQGTDFRDAAYTAKGETSSSETSFLTHDSYIYGVRTACDKICKLY